MIFDVLVVGAGPAGCAAAIRAAGRGLTVVLVERSGFPRDLPGEALHPDVDALFRDLGVVRAVTKAGFLRYPGWVLDRAGERSFVPFGGPGELRFGYQAWRAELDAALLARARRAGARVLQPARLRAVEMKEGRAQIDGKEVRFRHLVDASGANSWLRRELRLPVKRFSPRLIARFGYILGDPALGVIPEFREHPSGWTWLARVRQDCCQLVQLPLAGELPLPAPPPFDSAARWHGADVTWRLVSECAGPGYFLCGDAACVLDPAAPSGTARALAGGLKAAELIVRMQKDRLEPDAAASAYRDWCARQFVDQARLLASRYAGLAAPPVWLEGLEDRFAGAGLVQPNFLANARNRGLK
jgi:flavin-dependent dehydrogenase